MRTTRWFVILFALACARDVAQAPLPPRPDLAESNKLAYEQFVRAYARVGATSEAPPETRATALGELAMLFDAYERPEQALSLYDRALELDPENADWTYYRAMILERLGDLDQAVTAYRRVAALEPDDPQAWLRQARCLDRLGRLEEAAAAFEALLAAQPQHPEATAYLADRAIARGEITEAIVRLERARRAAPGSRILAFALGRAYVAAGRDTEAESLLDAASKHSIESRLRAGSDHRRARLQELVRSPIAHERRGLLAVDRGDWLVATTEFRQALALDPTLKSVRHNLAAVQLRMGQRAEAIATLERNLEGADEVSAVFVPSAVLLASLVAADDRQRAESLLARAASAAPDSSLVSAARGQIERSSGRPLRAVEFLEEALSEDPSRPTTWRELVSSYLQAGDTKGAARALRRFGEALPGETVLEPLGWRRLALEGSAAPCRRVVEQHSQPPSGASALESWALLLACAGEWDRAVEAQRRVAELVRSPGSARDRLDRFRKKRTGPVWVAGEVWLGAAVPAAGPGASS